MVEGGAPAHGTCNLFLHAVFAEEEGAWWREGRQLMAPATYSCMQCLHGERKEMLDRQLGRGEEDEKGEEGVNAICFLMACEWFRKRGWCLQYNSM